MVDIVQPPKSNTPWWNKVGGTPPTGTIRALVENPLIMTDLERLLATRLRVWKQQLAYGEDPVNIVIDMQRFIDRYEGREDLASAIAVAIALPEPT